MNTPETPRRIRVPAPRTLRDGFRTAVQPPTAVRRDSRNTHWRCVIMTRTRLPRQARERWAWLAAAAAAAAAGLLAVRHSGQGRDHAQSTAAGTGPAAGMAPSAPGIRTRLLQARAAAGSRISPAGGAAWRKLFRDGGGTPGEPETAETAGPPAATAPEQDETPPGAGNGSAAQASAADALPAHDR